MLDLRGLNDSELSYLRQCYDAYRDNVDWVHFNNSLLNGPENPLLRETHGVVVRSIMNHPLFQAVHDLSDRIGIAQAMLAPSGGVDVDPLDDEWIQAPEAAREKRVSLPGLHKAIARGDVIARTTSPEGKRLLVSAHSLQNWEPSIIRQAARRKARLSHSTGT